MVSLSERLSQHSMLSQKRYLGIIVVYIFAFFAIWTLATFWSRPGPNTLFTPHRTGDNSPDRDLPSLAPLKLPGDYYAVDEQPEICTKRLGFGYLEDLRHSRAQYCSLDSKSQVTCFHSQTDKGGRTDSFCIAEGAKVDQNGKKFLASCNSVNPIGLETNESSIPLASISSYWYDTGPRIILDRFIDLKAENLEHPSANEPQKFTALIKREGSGNPWHSLMEIMSLSMTFDVLQFSPSSRQSKDGKEHPFMSPSDASNTQVIILDDIDEGPYFDLWRLFAKKPTLRLSALPPNTDVGNIIIPLPGGSNPIWQGDWEPNSCTHSELLRTFSRRVLNHFQIPLNTPKPADKIIITFVDRRGTRKLIDIEKHIAFLKAHFEHTHAEIRVVDFVTMSLKDQIQTVRDSDVLAGVHGAGLTHVMWMKEHSVLVEILPKEFMHKGFRNVAGAMGIGYFSAHGGGMGTKASWQDADVVIEEEKLGELMVIAVKSIYNSGERNYDVTE